VTLTRETGLPSASVTLTLGAMATALPRWPTGRHLRFGRWWWASSVTLRVSTLETLSEPGLINHVLVAASGQEGAQRAFASRGMTTPAGSL